MLKIRDITMLVPLWLEKPKNLWKTWNTLQKLVSFFVIMFELPNHKTHKMVKKVIMSCKRPLSTLTSMFKNKTNKNEFNFQLRPSQQLHNSKHLGTPKASYGPLMELDARWASRFESSQEIVWRASLYRPCDKTIRRRIPKFKHSQQIARK